MYDTFEVNTSVSTKDRQQSLDIVRFYSFSFLKLPGYW